MSIISDEEIRDIDENIELENIEEENFQNKNNKEKVPENEVKLKPHQKVISDYTTGILPSQEETSDLAPIVIVVQGSKNVSICFLFIKFIFSKSGKSTVIKSLIKYYTRHKVSKISGTITIRSSKNQRITFIECPNDINSMIDYAKIADLALLLIDGSLGFEMETFEFLSILKVKKKKLNE